MRDIVEIIQRRQRAKAEIERLKKEISILDEEIKKYVERYYEIGKFVEIGGYRVSVTIQQRAKIVNEFLVPNDFRKSVPDTTKIRKALASGIAVPGAELASTYVVTIRNGG